MAYVRKVRTGSGAIAVQVVRKVRGRREILAHVGSAHTDAELGILLEKGRALAIGSQQDFGFEVSARTASVADVAESGPVGLFPGPAKPKTDPVGIWPHGGH